MPRCIDQELLAVRGHFLGRGGPGDSPIRHSQPHHVTSFIGPIRPSIRPTSPLQMDAFPNSVGGKSCSGNDYVSSTINPFRKHHTVQINPIQNASRSTYSQMPDSSPSVPIYTQVPSHSLVMSASSSNPAPHVGCSCAAHSSAITSSSSNPSPHDGCSGPTHIPG